jgi:hypothetical protein
MHISVRRVLLLVSTGAALSLLLQFAVLHFSLLAVPSAEAEVPHWYALSSGAMHTLVAVAPALLVGFIARTRGASLGLAIGILGALLFSAFHSVNWSSLEGTGMREHIQFGGELLSLSLGSGIIGFVAGAAGQLFGTRRAL